MFGEDHRGKDIKLAEPEDTKQNELAVEDKEQTKEGELPAPIHGFDETGEYFIVKIHIKYGYIFILGFLVKASDWLKMYVGKQSAEIEKRRLIKPQTTKGFGRFNLFRGK
jgi:hypothetical protein